MFGKIFDFVENAGETLARAVGLGGADVEDLTKALQSNGVTIDRLTLAIDKGVATIGGEASHQVEREKAVLVIGNTKGVRQVVCNLTLAPPPPPPPEVVQVVAATSAEPPESRFHTVEKGDTLWKIAQEVYGNGAKFNTIFEANTPMLKHPDRIYPGQVLRIPHLQA